MRIKITIALFTIFLASLSWKEVGGEAIAQNIGISATGATPDNSAMLDVVSTSKGILIPRMTGTEKYAITSPATGLLIFQTDTIGFWYYEGSKWIPLLSSTSSTSSSTGGWGISGNSNITASDFLGTTDNVSLRIRTNNTEKVIIDSTGRVGIGTTAPAYKLDILDANSAGSGVQSRTLNLYQTRTEANITAITLATGISNYLLCRMAEASPLLSNGYGAQNVVYTDGAYTFNSLRGARNIAYTNSSASANQNNLMGAENSAYLNSSGSLTTAWGTYNQAFNNSSGTLNTAIGATNYAFTNTVSTGVTTNAIGSYNLVQNVSTVGGSITQAKGVSSYIGKAATASIIPTGFLYYGVYSSGACTDPWGIYLEGEAKNYFSGNVGIGIAPTQKLHVSGNGLFTGTVTASCGVLVCSDIRFKKDIIPLPNTLNNVMKLKGVSYHWKTKEFPEKNFTDEKQIGFIAQDVEKIFPEVVMTDKDGYKSVDYSRLTPVLVEAIKEQQKIISSMQLAMDNQQKIYDYLKTKSEKSESETAQLKAVVEKLIRIMNTEETRRKSY